MTSKSDSRCFVLAKPGFGARCVIVDKVAVFIIIIIIIYWLTNSATQTTFRKIKVHKRT